MISDNNKLLIDLLDPNNSAYCFLIQVQICLEKRINCLLMKNEL